MSSTVEAGHSRRYARHDPCAVRPHQPRVLPPGPAGYALDDHGCRARDPRIDHARITVATRTVIRGVIPHCDASLRATSATACVQVGVQRDAGRGEHLACFLQAVSGEPHDHRHVQRGRFRHRLQQQLRELAHVRDAAEDVHEHDANARRRADPFEDFDEPGRFTAQTARSDVEEVEGLQPGGAKLVDQHHRQPRTGREESDLALGIDDHIVEAVFEFERDFRVGRVPLLREREQKRLALERVVVRDDLRIACEPRAVALHEKRVHLDEDRLALQKNRRKRCRRGTQSGCLRTRHALDQTPYARDDRVVFGRDRGRANAFVRQRFDLHASHIGHDHPHASRSRIEQQTEIRFLRFRDLLLDSHAPDALAFHDTAEHGSRVLGDFIACRGPPDDARLAAPTCGDLSFDDPRTLRQVADFGADEKSSFRSRDAVMREERFGVVFE